ncbi:hypothetical protein [Cryobacterium cryoconiti]|uniref:hypothetical protein n=1 Tax=Cryobacterium cryoconiti TaxID=1259239 RepID=UPI00141AF10D|nr:hypothetical protein [Cryobacterium cryoconiti]
MNQPQVTTHDETPDLLSRLAAIEGRPLEERAAAYVQEHDRLQRDLEGGDVPRVGRS